MIFILNFILNYNNNLFEIEISFLTFLNIFFILLFFFIATFLKIN